MVLLRDGEGLSGAAIAPRGGRPGARRRLKEPDRPGRQAPRAAPPPARPATMQTKERAGAGSPAGRLSRAPAGSERRARRAARAARRRRIGVRIVLIAAAAGLASIPVLLVAGSGRPADASPATAAGVPTATLAPAPREASPLEAPAFPVDELRNVLSRWCSKRAAS